ncbi:MAG TPA: hypothetical protein VF810_03745, partial [Patescibacteria group bacterium]
SADREMHHEEIIKPALKEGKVIVSDRCFWSVIPYGIMDLGGNLDANTAEYMLCAQSILSMYHQFTLPDFTFYLQLPLNLAMERIQRGGEEKEIYEDRDKLAQTIKGYNFLLQKFPEEFKVIDATKKVEEVTEEIISVIK